MNYERFDFNYKLSTEAETRSIFNRPYINARLTKIRTENEIFDYVEKRKREFGTRYLEGINYDVYIKEPPISVLKTVL